MDEATTAGPRFSQDCKSLARFFFYLEPEKSFLWGLLGITIVGTIIRLAFINRAIGYDEAYTYIAFATKTFKYIVTDYHVPNNHIFHTILVYLSTRLFGDALWVIRLPAFLAGVLLIPATYVVAHLFYRRYTALFSAMLVAVSSILIDYSTNARGYTLVCLISLLILALAAYLRQHKNMAGWVLWVTFSVLGFYTIPIMLYPFGIVAGWLLVSGLVKDVDPLYGNKFIRYLILAGVTTALVTLLLYASVFIVSGVKSVFANNFIEPLQGSAFLETVIARLRGIWRAWTIGMPVWASLLVGLGFLASLFFDHKPAGQRARLQFITILWLGTILIIQHVAPWPRVWLFLLPYFIIWTCAGLVGLCRMALSGKLVHFYRQASLAMVILSLLGTALLGWGVYRLNAVDKNNESGAFREAQQMATYLKGALQPGDIILTMIPTNYPLRYYFMRQGIPTKYFYQSADRPTFTRAFVITSLMYGQTVENIIQDKGLTDILNAASANIIQQYPESILSEIDR